MGLIMPLSRVDSISSLVALTNIFTKIYSGTTTLSNEEFGAIEMDSSFKQPRTVLMIGS
jgi:hypothetical protein